MLQKRFAWNQSKQTYHSEDGGKYFLKWCVNYFQQIQTVKSLITISIPSISANSIMHATQ